MFYPTSRIDTFLSHAQAAAVGQDVNDWIHETGLVVYGNVDREGQASGFGSVKRPDDFSVGFLIAVKLMGNAEPLKSPIAIPRVDDKTLLQAVLDKNKDLEKRLEQFK